MTFVTCRHTEEIRAGQPDRQTSTGLDDTTERYIFAHRLNLISWLFDKLVLLSKRLLIK